MEHFLHIPVVIYKGNIPLSPPSPLPSLSALPVPHRATATISPRESHSMEAWSLEQFVPPPSSCPGAPRDECYFVFYARGTGGGEAITFWVEIKASVTATTAGRQLRNII